ncbi:hypothetical protein MMYC01_207637 [Madurella mycetomatis]|uniref:FR47-like domain-containing protein n=1 Tax=Madurella mycetomatis TaxID=100816 RepID=A0A175VVB2_9PEZI|nr:hypothetical protein MMYC01_207637 [Madurella mycetomatis]
MTPATQPPKILLTDSPTPPAPLLALLHAHLPYSLPVLRRLQFARNFPGGATPHTHDQDKQQFAAAYVDLSRAPETQCWLYSTLEDGSPAGGSGDGGGNCLDHQGGRSEHGGEEERKEEGEEEEEEAAIDLVLAVLRRVRAIALAIAGADGKAVLVGSLHEGVRQGLLARGVVMHKTPNVPDDWDWEFCGKWLFQVEELPLLAHGEPPLPGMRWDRVRREDVGLVLSRTSIARQEATLLMLPSIAVRLADGTPVAWGFMGPDGSLITLHVEEPYRRLGLAKSVACRLMRDHLKDYGDDGWGAADVFVLNHKSQAMCKSIGGKFGWTMSWAMVVPSSVGDPM